MVVGLAMATRRMPTRAKTTPIETLHSLLTLQEADSAIRRRPVNTVLLSYDELPAWRQDNHLILTHYRPTSNSFFSSFQSLFQLHNESVNIHSHLFGAWAFLFIALSLYAFERHVVTWADTIAFFFFFTGAIICLGISATHHTVSNHSAKVQVPMKISASSNLHSQISQWMNQIDYLGIVILISGSFVPSVYYGFYCEPVLQRFYWGMVRLNKPWAHKDPLLNNRTIDRYNWHRLRYCIYEPKIPAPSLATISSRHVCRLRSLRRLSPLAWSVCIWI